MVTDGKKHATSSDKSSRHATPLSSNSGPRDKIPIRERFQTTRGPAVARIAGERSPENAGQINAVVISLSER